MGVWYKIRVNQMIVMGILASMEHRPPKLRFRVVMMTFLVLLTFTTGATIAVLNFLMESKQSREEGNKVLRLVSEDINDLTRFLLQTVSNRTKSMGRLADSGLLDFKTESLIIQGGKQILQSDAHIISIEIIEHSSGNMFQVTNDVNDKLIVTKTTRDPITNKIQLLKYDPNDLLLLHPKVMETDLKDPREADYYKEFQESLLPNWTEIRPPSPRSFSNFKQSFSYVYPIIRSGTFYGIISTEISVEEISKYLRAKNDKIGYGGIAFAVERKSDGTLVAIGTQADGLDKSNQKLLKVSESSNPSVRAFEKLVGKYDAMGIDSMNSTETLIDEVIADNGSVWNMAWTSILPGEKPYWAIVTTARRDLLVADAWNRFWTHFYFLTTVILVGGITIFLLSMRASGPLEAFAREMKLIGEGNIKPMPVPKVFVKELYDLGVGIEEMKLGLLSFRKYIPGDVVSQVIRSHKTADLFVEKKNITVFFTDLRDFTNMSESLDPDILIRILGDHLAICTRIIQKYQGTIDKFIGDSVMAFWNAPSAVKDHPVQACLAALECQAAMKSFNKANLAQGLPSLFMRIGIHTGEALVGNIGSDTRLNYTAVGDTVNLASRLEGTNKEYGTSILISESTRNQIAGRILTRLVDKVAVKGKTKPGEIHEVLATQEDDSPLLRQIIDLTHQGRTLFETRQFAQAKLCHEQLLQLNPDDGVARLYLQRCDHYIANPPPPNWDAISHSETK